MPSEIIEDELKKENQEQTRIITINCYQLVMEKIQQNLQVTYILIHNKKMNHFIMKYNNVSYIVNPYEIAKNIL